MLTYEQTCQMLDKHGTLYGQSMELDNGRISVDGCVTLEDARSKCMDLALQAGWKEPSWFQEHILGKKN